MKKNCLICKKEFKTKPSHYERRKYCSYGCYDIARKETMKGENNPSWKGGLPKCADCKVNTPYRNRLRCNSCRRIFSRGSNHYNWQGGITNISAKIRNSIKYKIWRSGILKRDNYTCLWCGQIGGKLNVDHIRPFSKFPELRFDDNNARTLCVSCHKLTDTYLSKARLKIYG